MSKPVLPVTITNSRRKSVTIPAVFDSGSFYTLIRRDCLPAGTPLDPLNAPRTLRAASRGSRLRKKGSAKRGQVLNLELPAQIQDSRPDPFHAFTASGQRRKC